MATGVGGLQLLDVLGLGGMGIVWRARHRESGEVVAVKILKDADEAAFAREARTVASLHHPAIVQVYDYGRTSREVDSPEGVTPGSSWLAMELLGPSLHETAATLDWSGVRSTAEAVLAGLGHAHARGVLHLDVKPGNVLRDALGAWRLVDWGLAQALGPVARVAGTPGYIAPEVFRARDVGPWSDLYSLGATLWHVVCGGPPEDVPFAPRVTVPAGLRDWLEELLAPRVADRFARAVDARDALHALGPAATRPAPDRRRSGVVRPTLSLDDPMDDGPAEARPPAAARARAIPAEWPDPPAPPHLPPLLGLGLVGLRTPVFVGRRADRAVLWGALREAAETGRPLEVRLEGPPGSGRWRLATELAYRVEEEGVARSLVAEDGAVDPREVAHRSAGGPVVVVVRHPAPALLDALDGPVLLVTLGEADARASPPARVHVLEPLDVETCSALVDQLVSLDVRARQTLCRTPSTPGDLVAIVRALATEGAFVPGPHGVTLAAGTSLDRPAAAPALPADDRRWLGLAAFLAPRVNEARWRVALDRLGVERPSTEAAFRAGWIQARRDGLGASPAQARALLAALEPHELRDVARVAATVLDEDERWTEAGFAHARAGDVDRAVAAYERARDLACARLFYDEAEAIGARIVELLRAHGRASDAAVEETWTAWNLANLDRPRAFRLAEDVLERARRQGWELAEGAALHCLAVLERDAARRRARFQEAEHIYLRLGRQGWYEWARLLRLSTVDLVEADAVFRTWEPVTISRHQVEVQHALVLVGLERFEEARALLAQIGERRTGLRPGAVALAWLAAGAPESARAYAVRELGHVPNHRTLTAYLLLVAIAAADVLVGSVAAAADALRRSARVASLLADDVPQLRMAVEAAFHARTADGPAFDRSLDAFASAPLPLFPVAAHGAVLLLEAADRSWRAGADGVRADRAGEVARSTRTEVRAHLGVAGA